MTAIERTAYPRFKRRPSAQELADVYTPTADELTLIRTRARGASPTLTLAVLLKAFARLGYFPRVQEIPFAVIAHLRSCLRLPPGTALDVTPRTLYKHHAVIRAFLRVQSWGPAARHAAVVAMHEAAQVKDHPADLMNVAIEDLVRQRFELPAFSALDRLVSRIRALVHRRLFGLVLSRLSEEDRRHLDALLDSTSGNTSGSTPARRSAYNELKQPPRKPSLSHFETLLAHLRWVEQLGDNAPLLAGVTPAKVRHFAAEARVLDAAELKDTSPPKRYTLLLCLTHRAQIQARDDLVEMFCKRMARIQTRAKEALEQIRIQHRETTETLVATLADVLQVVDQESSDAELGRRVKQAVTSRGDVREQLAAREAITAYSGDNFLPPLWRFYRSHRQLLFRLARTLHFRATTQDTTLLEALAVVLANEDRVGDWLSAAVEATVDLSFASDQWRHTVELRTTRGVRGEREKAWEATRPVLVRRLGD